jgi:hypothetical protein
MGDLFDPDNRMHWFMIIVLLIVLALMFYFIALTA